MGVGNGPKVEAFDSLFGSIDAANKLSYNGSSITNTLTKAATTFTGVTFDGTNYYIGVGAATGGSNDNHILKSMKLTF